MDGGHEFIETHYDEVKDWAQDPSGYFLIRINREEGCLEVAFCKEKNNILQAFKGKKPQDIYHAVAGKNLISRLDHAAYLGKELEKAYLALKYGLDYVQDEELNLS